MNFWKKPLSQGTLGMRFRTQGSLALVMTPTGQVWTLLEGGGLLPESHPASLLVDPGFTDCFVTLETRSFGWLGLTCRQSDTQERLPPK